MLKSFDGLNKITTMRIHPLTLIVVFVLSLPSSLSHGFLFTLGPARITGGVQVIINAIAIK